MGLSQFNIIELSTAVMTIAGAIALVLKTTQQSRCKTCSMCWGMNKCDRELPIDVLDKDEVDLEKGAKATMPVH